MAHPFGICRQGGTRRRIRLEKLRSKQKAADLRGLQPSLSCALRQPILRGGILFLGGTPFLAKFSKSGVAKRGRSVCSQARILAGTAVIGPCTTSSLAVLLATIGIGAATGRVPS